MADKCEPDQPNPRTHFMIMTGPMTDHSDNFCGSRLGLRVTVLVSAVPLALAALLTFALDEGNKIASRIGESSTRTDKQPACAAERLQQWPMWQLVKEIRMGLVLLFCSGIALNVATHLAAVAIHPLLWADVQISTIVSNTFG